jgi:hypothetical protein
MRQHCRFEDLPIATLSAAAAGADPQVVAGLVAIAKLDEELREASLKVGRVGGARAERRQGRCAGQRQKSAAPDAHAP